MMEAGRTICKMAMEKKSGLTGADLVVNIKMGIKMDLEYMSGTTIQYMLEIGS